MSNAVGRRYAKALFELSKEGKSLDQVSKNLDDLSDALDASPELQNLVNSPVISRAQKASAIAAISKKAGFETVVAHTLGVMAQNGRLAELPATIRAFAEFKSAENDELIAEVVSAKEMSADQTKKLASVLKAKMGKDVALQTRVDPEILGGLVINIGSTMIDNSLKGKLSKLHNAMKEVG